MKQALLDTNFIIVCINQKIDFFHYFELEGIRILIPSQVINELRKLKSKLALKILEKNKNRFKKIDLKAKNVDFGIKKFAEQNKNIIVATLDKELKRKLKNKKIVIRRKKKLEFV